jgi:hypothetical protein
MAHSPLLLQLVVILPTARVLGLLGLSQLGLVPFMFIVGANWIARLRLAPRRAALLRA